VPCGLEAKTGVGPGDDDRLRGKGIGWWELEGHERLGEEIEKSHR